MTRFARAKGSKSSNEKLPEDATPWSELKKSMLKPEKLSEETKKSISVLKSKTQDAKPSEWASLDNGNEDSLSILRNHLEKGNKVKTNLKSNCSHSLRTESRNIQKLKRKHVEAQEGSPVTKSQKVKNVENISSDVDSSKLKEKDICIMESECSDSLAGLNKIKGKSKHIVKTNGSGKNKVGVKQRKNKTILNDKVKADEDENDKVKENTGSEESNILKNVEKLENETKRMLKKKMKNFAGGKPVERSAAINSKSFKSERKFKNLKNGTSNLRENKFTTKIDIGGKTVSLVKFQGFYVTEEDGKRLKELKKKMIEEGIEKSQIESALKLERRRCEKSLARMKKNVCFQCRKPGHILSQCPEMQNNIDTSTGVCYKCGSTEHTAFTCKVAHGKNFPFAECFICKEKGHIARECPDNPKGLYPKGGCCKLCGDVTHLKKDCPKRLSEMEEQTIRLKLLDNRNLEGLEDIGMADQSNNDKKLKKKPVHF